MNTYRCIVLPDIHFPVHDKRSLDATLQYVADNGPYDFFVQLGDLGDWDSCSSHNKNDLRKIEGKRIFKDAKACNAGLDLIASAFPNWKTMSKWLLEGNHEYRLERAIGANPNLEGLAEVPKLLGLEERGIHWVKSWSTGEFLTIGNALFTHGLYHGKNHIKLSLTAIDRPLFYGHTHNVEEQSKLTLGENKQISVMSLGCLMDFKVDYMRGRPHRWQQAFAEFSFLPDGYFNCYVTKIFKNRFIGKDGKVYKG